MEFDKQKIETRIRRLDELMKQSDDLIEKAFNALEDSELRDVLKKILPGAIIKKILNEQGKLELGDEARKKIKKILDKVLNNEKLKDLIEGIKNKRPPRVVIAGEQGIGKSSLINALLGEYAVEVGKKYGAQTLKSQVETVTDNGDKILRVLDTRGLDDYARDEESEASKQLKEDITKFSPDIILFVLHVNREAHQQASFEVMKDFQEDAGGVPIITALNRADELAPKKRGKPVYDSAARERFKKMEHKIEQRLNRNNIDAENIITTCAYMEWDDAKKNITYERLYGIDRLYNELTDSLELEAKINLNMHSRIEDVIFDAAHRLSWSSAGAASLIGGAHFIPFSDMYILLPFELILVMIIAYLSGKPMEVSSALELVNAAGLTGGIAYFSRFTFQQLSKFIPGKGTAAAAGVAGAGVYAIGMVAAYYFIRGKNVNLSSLYDRLFEIFKEKDAKIKTGVQPTAPDISDLPEA